MEGKTMEMYSSLAANQTEWMEQRLFIISKTIPYKAGNALPADHGLVPGPDKPSHDT